ncbi:unnamed protein product [Orchesella dallaii]|uniref:Fucosyltransferase n=1 Tax=Orchesella dallaii TaxID=48710 RepID=A0ABP1RMK3_9HEXA
MVRCNFIKCLRVVICIILTYILVVTVTHMTNRNKFSESKTNESNPLSSFESEMRIRNKLKLELRKTKHKSENIGHIIKKFETTNYQAVLAAKNIELIENNNRSSDFITLRFWELVNNFRNNNTFLTEESFPFPNLWRQEKQNLSLRDEDRILPQLILGMDVNVTNFTLKSNQIHPKIIYLPQSFAWWGNPNWTSPHSLEEQECPGNFELFHHCTFSENPDSMDVMDALITTDEATNFRVPSHVLKIHYRLETSAQNEAKLVRSNDLLASHYRGSDINTPYGKWVYYDPAVKFKTQEKDYAVGKTKMAAAFISNCNSINRRLKFAHQLQRYVNVDIYGFCGELECFKYKQEECFAMLKKEYHFFLSFENTNCRDYITEKLFINAFENDIIPIVLGAHPDDYKATCPEKSYIHVEDFENPKALANYMQHLVENPVEYNSYFRWKGTGEFIDTHFFCRICAMVHYADIVPPPKRTSAFRWNWKVAVRNKFCLPRGVWYWNSSVKTGMTYTLHTLCIIVVFIFHILSRFR